MTENAAEQTSLTLDRIAEWAGGRVHGDGDTPIERVRPLDRADAGSLGLVADARYVGAVPESGAGALLVAAGLEERVAAVDDRPRVVVEDPRAAMIPILERLDPTPRHEPGVHPTAVVEHGVRIGEGVSVGPRAVLEEGAVIGRGTRIGAHCVVGRRARIGEDGYLHPHVVVYAESVIGDRVILHAGARIGSDGFGYAFEQGRYVKIPQVGRAVLGDDVEIGANSCIDRGSIGDTEIGDGVKIDNLVQMGHNVRIGDHGAFAALNGVAGSTVIGAYARFAGQVGVTGHLELADRLTAGPATKILQSVSEPDTTIMGFPARDQREATRLWAAERRLPDLLRRVRALEKQLEASAESDDGDEAPGEAAGSD
ncbi:MAG TPA: UDP-3-O-(3-hydroxymyristoyl)glucosamine N-acyltransferase [Longimicrobiales bacterium]|nr:UDP-3-O-(3-hydroxymyristoyl)glucosamine N-acyltransferase [Longimicrobiales bacterium]